MPFPEVSSFWNKNINIKLCGSGTSQPHHPSKSQWKLRSEKSLPSFHFSEVKSNLSVGHSLLIQVAAIPPYERWHIIAYITKKRSKGIMMHVTAQMNIGRIFKGVLLQNVYSVSNIIFVICNIPCRPLLSKKLLRLNSVFLEARYCINLCKKKNIIWGTLYSCKRGVYQKRCFWNS